MTRQCKRLVAADDMVTSAIATLAYAKALLHACEMQFEEVEDLYKLLGQPLGDHLRWRDSCSLMDLALIQLNTADETLRNTLATISPAN